MVKEPIIPLGGSTLDPSRGFQERNLENLLKIFEKKEASEALTEMAKTDKDTWVNIKTSVADLKEFVLLGGTGAIITGFKTQIEDSIEFVIADKLSPITNTLDELVADYLDPILDKLSPLINTISEFIAGNSTGAFFGAMMGYIGGPIGAIIGALFGAWYERIFGPDPHPPGFPDPPPGSVSGYWMWKWDTAGGHWVWIETGGGTDIILKPPPDDQDYVFD